MARILIVDDDAAIGDMLEGLLTREGYAVSRAYSGTDGSPKMHVSNLRKKLQAAGGEDCIEAVWGIGFRLRGEGGF